MKKKKLFTAIICIIAILVSACTAVFGDGPSTLIDTNRKGSLTLYKLRENSGNVVNGDGTVNDTESRPGMQGIVFSIVKIADFEMMIGKEKTVSAGVETEGTETLIGNYFTGLDDGFKQLFTGNGIALPNHKINNTICYSTEDLSTALISLCSLTPNNGEDPGEVQINDYVKEHGNHYEMDATDSNGRTIKSELPLGLYLVAETNYRDYEKNTDLLGKNASNEDVYSKEIIANPSSPFLVSLPMSVQNGTQADSWQYDVVAYPKNQTVSVSKYIVKQSDNNTLVQSEDFEIGDIVHEVITVSAPAVAHLLGENSTNRNYENFVISDALDYGLSVVKVNSVMIGPRILSPNKFSQFDDFQKLSNRIDYKVVSDAEGNTELPDKPKEAYEFHVKFLEDGLAKLNALSQDSEVVISFDVVVTNLAAVGDAKSNTNIPALSFKFNNTKRSTVNGNTPTIYSYKLNILKQGVSDNSKVSFGVKRRTEETSNNGVETTFIDMSFIKDREGIYHPFDAINEETSAVRNTLSPDSQGHLTIRGLDANTYEFTELSTDSGHELLKSKFQVVLEGKNPVDGNLESATLISDNKQTSLAISKGTAGLTVKNFKSLILRTGGAGGKILMIGAAVSLLIFFVLFLAIRRRRGA